MITKRLFFILAVIAISNIVKAHIPALYNVIDGRNKLVNGYFDAQEYQILSVMTELELNAFITNASCFGACDGNIDLVVSGGQPPYSYIWNTGNLSEDLGNVCSDIYSVTVSDASGSIVDSSYVITEPALLGLLAFGTDASCFGLCDGSIDLDILPGGPYDLFIWDSIVNTSSLCTGEYMVTAVNSNGCPTVVMFSINSPEQLILNIIEIIDETNGESNGSVEVSASGGVLPYSFSINSGPSIVSNLFTGLPSGTFIFCVQDGNGCTECEEVVVNNLTALDELVAKFRCYPNPASTFMYLESDQPLSFDILNIQGRILKHVEKSLTHQINLEDFVPGVYVARISDGIGVAYRKIVVE